MQTIYTQNVNELDGILYQDIKDILKDKIQLENVLFTTKIIFVDNSELVEFMNKLMVFGYEDMALDYAENIYGKLVVDFSKLRYENKIK